MMTTEIVNEFKASGYIFKVLSGSLNGIEFSLGPYSYFMCVGDTENQGNLAQTLELSERTLYLPAAAPCNNFTLNLAENETGEEFDVKVSYETHQDSLTLAFNTICQVGGVCFALKREGNAWSQEVLSGVLPPPVLTEKTHTAAPAKKSRWRYKSLIAACMVLILGVGGTAAWWNFRTVEDVSPAVVDQLVGKNAGYSVYKGRDNANYIFAKNNQQAEWARQAVVRSQSADTWKVVTPQEEEARLARVLDRNKISFFTVRFNDPRTPTLVMSSTSNATDAESLKKVSQLLLDVIPYARTVNIDLQDDKNIVRSAQEGLLALGFDYQMVQSDSGVTLLSPMTAEDSRLAVFSRYVEQFHRTWGRRYVHFSAELSDDWLKGKSFKYGKNGYVNMSKSHWLFNNQN